MSAMPKPVWTPRIAQVDTIVPGCRFHVGSGTENFRVTQFGGELEFTRRMMEEIRSGDVFFDIGACIGFVAVHARKRGAGVVAFEPEPSFRARLKENLALNGQHDVPVVDWAVSDAVGTATLFTDGAHGTSPTLATTAPRDAVEISTGTIDNGLATENLPWPTLMKMDIEGAEVRALRGMRGLLRSSNKPRAIFIEVHPPMIQTFGDDVSELHAILTRAGYELATEEGRWEQLHHIWRAC